MEIILLEALLALFVLLLIVWWTWPHKEQDRHQQDKKEGEPPSS